MSLSVMRLQHRRTTDDRSVHYRARQSAARLGRSWDAVTGGQSMWWASGFMVVLTLPLIDKSGWRAAATLTTIATIAVGTAFFMIPWRRLPSRLTLLMPITSWLTLTALAGSTHGLAAYYTALYVLWFAYIGLTQPAGTSVFVVPVAVACYIRSWGGLTEQLIARLLIAVAVWLLLSELLASLVSRQRQMTDELRKLAQIDPLTNLANRRGLDIRLAEIGPHNTVVICDLDHFKLLNDTQGHAAGDRVLAEFGFLLRTCLRQGDFAARYGGEEFALVLHASEQQAAIVLNRLRQRWAIMQPGVTFSSGIAGAGVGRSGADVLGQADRALYAAKADGRNRDHSSAGPVSAIPAQAEDTRLVRPA